MIRTLQGITLLLTASTGCGSLESAATSQSEQPTLTNYMGQSSTSTDEFAGTYVLDTFEVMSSSGTMYGYVLSGRCAITLGPANSSGWRDLKNSSYCRIGTSSYNSLVVETSQSRVQLNSLGAVINVDASKTVSTTPLPTGLKVLYSSMTFTSYDMVYKTNMEQDGVRYYQTHIYVKE